MLTLPLLLAAAVAATPSHAEVRSASLRFEAGHAGARLLRTPGGGLHHASGFAAPRRAAQDEENARRFLAEEGRAFGVGSDAELETWRVTGAPGAGGSARFRRLVLGRPVFGGDVTVGWRADGAITVVNGSPTLGTEPRGEATIGPEEARRVALGAAPGVPGASSVELGWLEDGGGLAPAYRVLHDATAPLEAFTSYVDARTGALLYRTSRKVAAAPCPSCAGPGACVCAYLVSPLAPPQPDGSSAPPSAFPLRGFATSGPGSRLVGDRTTVFDCAGQSVSGSDASGVRACTAQLALGDTSGSFLAAPDATQVRTDDAFAEQSAYFHIDDHSRFMDGLDPAFAQRTAQGGIGRIDGYVNVYASGAPFGNAFFQPSGGLPGTSGIMVYGQASLVDTAYDGEIVYHELTHAAVGVTASFEDFVDPSSGVNGDPTAVNEGTADTFAFSHVADALARAGLPIDSAACLSRYFGAQLGIDCLRQFDNAKTCRGNGPNDGRNPGRDGEPHDDSEVWTGFTWALVKAAHDADPAGANGWRQALVSALFQALEASSSRASFQGYAQTVLAKVDDAVHARKLPQEAADFARCTYAQRDLDGCADRAVALYSGEAVLPLVLGLNGQAPRGPTPVSQQYFVDVPCDAQELHVQVGDATSSGRVLVRYARPIEFLGLDFSAPQYDWRIDGDHPDLVLSAGQACRECAACAGGRTPFGAGRWYFLPVAPPQDAGGNTNVAQLGVSLSMKDGAAPPARPLHVVGKAAGDANACAWGGGPAPSPGPSVIAATAPPLACPGPGAPSACETPSTGCGCGASDPSAAALGGLALLALRRRLGRGAGARAR
jgi:hypothetical protein